MSIVSLLDYATVFLRIKFVMIPIIEYIWYLRPFYCARLLQIFNVLHETDGSLLCTVNARIWNQRIW